MRKSSRHALSEKQYRMKADCPNRKPGFGRCFRPEGHKGKCLSFSDTGPPLRPATEWTLSDTQTQNQAASHDWRCPYCGYPLAAHSQLVQLGKCRDNKQGEFVPALSNGTARL